MSKTYPSLLGRMLGFDPSRDSAPADQLVSGDEGCGKLAVNIVYANVPVHLGGYLEGDTAASRQKIIDQLGLVDRQIQDWDNLITSFQALSGVSLDETLMIQERIIKTCAQDDLIDPATGAARTTALARTVAEVQTMLDKTQAQGMQRRTGR